MGMDRPEKRNVFLIVFRVMRALRFDSSVLLFAALILLTACGNFAFAVDSVKGINNTIIFSEGVIPDYNNIIHVDDNAPNDPGPCDPTISDPLEKGTLKHPFDTIQEGIDAAMAGDLVAVFPGVYTEAIDFLGKAITVSSEGEAAVIRAPNDYAVSFTTAESANSVLRNFVIRDSSIGIFIVDSCPTIANITVVKNGFGIVAYSAVEANVHSSIFWYNTDGDFFGCNAKYSCIEDALSEQGNISLDPCFADPNNDDYHLRSIRGRYWPTHNVWVLDDVSSPCIDAGDPNVTQIHERKPNGSRVNMGAYGASYYASLSANDVCPDFNHDNFVDWFDFSFFANHWLRGIEN